MSTRLDEIKLAVEAIRQDAAIWRTCERLISQGATVPDVVDSLRSIAAKYERQRDEERRTQMRALAQAMKDLPDGT